MREWIAQHWGHLAGASGAGGGLILVLFRDSLKEAWAEYRADRRASREDKARERGSAGKLEHDLVMLLREDLTEQRANGKELIAILHEIAVTSERMLDAQKAHGGMLSDMDKRLLRIEGAVNANGRHS